uniref:ANF_receptor domain-containing protein n=1 Tax=Ascaris lumbricoides TaxID=6252 RepID=A0A0M3IBZ8_ASCLU
MIIEAKLLFSAPNERTGMHAHIDNARFRSRDHQLRKALEFADSLSGLIDFQRSGDAGCKFSSQLSMWRLIIIGSLIFIDAVICQQKLITLKMGITMPMNTSFRGVSFANTVGAVVIALEDVRRDGYIQFVDFSATYREENCLAINASGNAIELTLDDEVDVIFGPLCNSGKII